MAVETVAQVLQVPYCRIWQTQSDGQTLRSRAQTGWPAAAVSMDIGAAILQHATGTIRLSCCDRGGPDPSPLPLIPGDSASGLGVVVMEQGVPLAFIEVYSRQVDAFPAQESGFLQAVGQVLATAIVRQRTENLLAIQGQILKDVVAGAALVEVLRRLCVLIEAQSPGCICAIVQVDGSGERLAKSVAPSMPKGYSKALESLDSLNIHETGLPCGVAVRLRELVCAQDVTQNPRWEKIRDFAWKWQIQTYWSMPFGVQTGKVLGTFVMLHPVVCEPSAHHRQLMQTATELASLVVEQSRGMEQLQRQALYDSLTGLCNRIFFIEQLRQNFQDFCVTLERRRQGGGLGFAVLFLDVDHFKVVNDSLGHTLGDQLLVSIARRVERCLRKQDTFARLGGDEFAILLKDVQDVDLVQAIADRIKAVLSFPFQIGEREVFTSVSVGIVHSDNGYETPEEVLRDADIAMYRSKAQGRSSATVFDKTMHAHVLSRLHIETGLQQAVQDLLLNQEPQFELHYQPTISLGTGAIVGFEALLRWQNPELGRLSPLEFIPIAEETGLIVPLGRWALQSAVEQLRRWQAIPGYAHLTMSVNVSSRQFIQPEFLSDIHHLLQSTQVRPSSLRLEITESVLMETVTAVMVRLEQLRDMGIHLSLDDFGTGYSSLSYLQRFPIHTLKVDRSFVLQLEMGQEEIVRAIVALAHGLKMDTVAEGIETREQLLRLKALGCEYGQGYLFSPPVTHGVAEGLLTTVYSV
jgi:diguanylate cyclase (GGDEF)-like protein